MQMAAQKAAGSQKPSHPMRVIDQVESRRKPLDHTGLSMFNQPYLATPAMLGNTGQQALNCEPLGHRGMLPLYQPPHAQVPSTPNVMAKVWNAC